MQDPTDDNAVDSPTPCEPVAAVASSRRQIGVPRRFAVGTAMIITAMYSVLFAVMKSLGAHPLVMVIVAVFFTVVGAAQMLLFGGRRPREASIIAGAVFCGAMSAVGHLIAWFPEGGSLGFHPFAIIGWLLCSTLGLALVGVLLGYVAGCLTAGVFLILNRIDHALHGPTRTTRKRGHH